MQELDLDTRSASHVRMRMYTCVYFHMGGDVWASELRTTATFQLLVQHMDFFSAAAQIRYQGTATTIASALIRYEDVREKLEQGVFESGVYP